MSTAVFGDIIGGLRIAIIAGGSLLLIHLLKLSVDRVTRTMVTSEAGRASKREKRTLTLANILKTVGTTVIVLIGAMMGLREIGFDVTPIVAGAAVW